MKSLADVSDIFYFFLLGDGEGGVRGRREAGGVGFFLLKIPEGGGVSRRGGDEGPGECRQRIGDLGGGGLNIFFSGPKCPPRKYRAIDL